MKKIVTASCVGTFGRFGNSLFQYAFARAYAELIGAELHTPDWIGRKLFEGIEDPIQQENEFEKTEQPNGRDRIDLYGYFQRPEHLALLSRAKLKEWFRPKNEFKYSGHEGVFHLRRGDYIKAGCYAMVNYVSYERAAKSFGYDPSRMKVYSDSRPVDEQYHDFFWIMASAAIFRSNSTYAWWAATLSDARVFSPVVENQTGWLDCEFVEGNHPKIFHEFSDLHIKE